MGNSSVFVLHMLVISLLVWSPVSEGIGTDNNTANVSTADHEFMSNLIYMPQGTTKLCTHYCTCCDLSGQNCRTEPDCCAQISCNVPGKPPELCYVRLISCNCKNCP